MFTNYIRRHKVYICYFDESGFKGKPHPKQKHAKWFVLSCIMIKEADWLAVLNDIVNLRKELKNKHGIPSHVELKGKDFRSGLGAFEGLNPARSMRMKIYKDILNLLTTLPVIVFCVAVKKEDAKKLNWDDSMYCAWNFALNRLNRKLTKEDDRCIIHPDEGHAALIRKCMRVMRRHNYVPRKYGGGTFHLRTERVLEDPSSRKSTESYFIQIADLLAYAAHRSKYIDSIGKMDKNLWDELSTEFDDVRLLDINKNVGGYPPGIKVYPQKARNPI